MQCDALLVHLQMTSPSIGLSPGPRPVDQLPLGTLVVRPADNLLDVHLAARRQEGSNLMV